MGLPFRSNYNAIKQITIKDGYGGEIDIPSRGFASIKEYNEVTALLINSSNSGNPDLNKLVTIEQDIVVIMLRHRFRDFETPKEELLKLESGEELGVPMLKALYDFFSKELGLDKLNQDEKKQSELIPLEEIELPGFGTTVEAREKSTRNSRKGLVNASS